MSDLDNQKLFWSNKQNWDVKNINKVNQKHPLCVVQGCLNHVQIPFMKNIANKNNKYYPICCSVKCYAKYEANKLINKTNRINLNISTNRQNHKKVWKIKQARLRAANAEREALQKFTEDTSNKTQTENEQQNKDDTNQQKQDVPGDNVDDVHWKLEQLAEFPEPYSEQEPTLVSFIPLKYQTKGDINIEPDTFNLQNAQKAFNSEITVLRGITRYSDTEEPITKDDIIDEYVNKDVILLLKSKISIMKERNAVLASALSEAVNQYHTNVEQYNKLRSCNKPDDVNIRGVALLSNDIESLVKQILSIKNHVKQQNIDIIKTTAASKHCESLLPDLNNDDTIILDNDSVLENTNDINKTDIIPKFNNTFMKMNNYPITTGTIPKPQFKTDLYNYQKILNPTAKQLQNTISVLKVIIEYNKDMIGSYNLPETTIVATLLTELKAMHWFKTCVDYHQKTFQSVSEIFNFIRENWIKRLSNLIDEQVHLFNQYKNKEKPAHVNQLRINFKKMVKLITDFEQFIKYDEVGINIDNILNSNILKTWEFKPVFAKFKYFIEKSIELGGKATITPWMICIKLLNQLGLTNTQKPWKKVITKKIDEELKKPHIDKSDDKQVLKVLKCIIKIILKYFKHEGLPETSIVNELQNAVDPAETASINKTVCTIIPLSLMHDRGYALIP